MPDPLTSVIAEAYWHVGTASDGHVSLSESPEAAAAAVRAYLTTPEAVERAARILFGKHFGEDEDFKTPGGAWCMGVARTMLAAVLDEGGTDD